jgi:hypothetical protein
MWKRTWYMGLIIKYPIIIITATVVMMTGVDEITLLLADM